MTLSVPRLQLYGYLFEPILQTADIVDIPTYLAMFADQRGYDLQCIYLERQATAPAAFSALLDVLDELPTGSAVVAVPTFSHLNLPGWHYRELSGQLYEATGMPVILTGYEASAAVV